MRKTERYLLIGIAGIFGYLWYKKQTHPDTQAANLLATQTAANVGVNAVRAAQGQSQLPL